METSIDDNENIVDVFYYDYILTKAIEVYKSGISPSKAVTHLQIATILCKRIRAENIQLDQQLYLKEAYLKVLQMLKFYEDKFITNKYENDITVFLKGLECLKTIFNEFSEIKENLSFKKLCIVSLAIYNKIIAEGGKESIEKTKVWVFIKELQEKLNENDSGELKTLTDNFSQAAVSEYLKTIYFENPVMKKFTEFVISNINKG